MGWPRLFSIIAAGALAAGCTLPHDPTPVKIAEGTVDFDVSGGATCTLDGTAGVDCVGDPVFVPTDPNGTPQPLVIPPALHIATSSTHTCAAHVAGVSCWGYLEGKDTFVAPTAVPNMTVALAIDAGGAQSCAIDGDHVVMCWSGTGSAAPLERPDHTPLTATQLSMAGDRACALDPDGAVWCWGDGTAPVLRDPGPLTGFALGVDHDCWIAAGGKVMCEGEDLNGESGDDATARHCTSQPCTVGPTVVDVPPAVAIAVGERHSCSVGVDGTVWCWGSNEWSQLGRSDVYLLGGPAQVVGLPAVTGIALGDAHSCARTGAGDVYCWGQELGFTSDLTSGGGS